MNYLAHAYLSFGDPEILVGNMISDFVKGKKKFDFSEGIQKGIVLHRQIDTFTDEHEVTRTAKNFFRSHYRLYSGAFVDIVYDHFLAIDQNEFSETSLFNFSQSVYEMLDQYIHELPSPFARMFPYMKMHNWLFNYRLKTGAERSFGGLARRAAYIEESHTAFTILTENYLQLKQCYSLFFPDLKLFARHIFDDLVKE